MASPIDKLVIALGLDSAELRDGLQKASQSISDFGRRVDASGNDLDRVALTASKTGIVINGVSDAAAERILQIGSSGQKAAVTFIRAMDSVADKVGHVTSLVGKLLAPLAAAFAGGKIIGNLSQMGEQLSVLSERTGVAVDKIDAWAKANRDAGGSEEAFRSALEQWTVEQGRSADDFFRMGEAVKGMSQQQAAYFMRAMGLSQDAAAVFTKYTDKAQEAAKAYAGSAMTPEQAKMAREMNIQWRRFTDQSQALGSMLAVTVLPIVNKVLNVITNVVSGIRENGRFIKIVLGGIGTIITASVLRPVLSAAGGFAGLFKTIKSGTAITAAFNTVVRANPLGVVITAFTALALVVEDFFTFLSGGKSLFEDFLHFLGIPQKYIDGWRKTVSSFFEVLASLPGELISALGDVWGKAKAFGEWVAGLGSSISSLGGLIIKALGSLPELLSSVFDSLFDALSGVGGALKDSVIDGFSSAIDWATSAFWGLIEQIGEWIDSALDIGGKAKDALSGAVDSAKDAIGGVFGGVADFFGFGDALESTGNTGSYQQDEKARSDRRSAMDQIGGVVVGAMQSAPVQAAGGMVAATRAAQASTGVANTMDISVVNNIQTTSDDPQAVGQAVGSAMDNALSRRNRMLVAAQSGVISK